VHATRKAEHACSAYTYKARLTLGRPAPGYVRTQLGNGARLLSGSGSETAPVCYQQRPKQRPYAAARPHVRPISSESPSATALPSQAHSHRKPPPRPSTGPCMLCSATPPFTSPFRVCAALRSIFHRATFFASLDGCSFVEVCTKSGGASVCRPPALIATCLKPSLLFQHPDTTLVTYTTKTSETFVTYICNIRLKHLKHLKHTLENARIAIETNATSKSSFAISR
jgi:hypothetical protein